VGLFMLRDPDTPVRRACKRRYSAWTLYARAFVGNRADADDVVRRAVNRTLQLSDDLTSERQAHERVLAAIRSEALELLKRRRRGARAAQAAPTLRWCPGCRRTRAGRAAQRVAVAH